MIMGVIDIYIPIWIDLKAQPRNKERMVRYDLHSNMDRFERGLIYPMYQQVFEIYIPIWIDLKASPLQKMKLMPRKFTFQYG